jgi:high affinity sulfate transporter 1
MTGLLTGYRKEWFRGDAVAGLTTAAVVIPQSMAYASIAGLPVEAGLYVALVPMVVYALLGTSRQLSVSTTSTLAILTAAALATAVPGGDSAHLIAAASTLALLVGVVLLLAGFLRLGFLANFISDPVLTGFKAGIGLVILIDQVPKLLGVQIERGGFFHKVVSTLKEAPQANRGTVILAAAMLAILFGMKRFLPRVPAPLVAVVLGIAAAGFLGLKGFGIALTGQIPAGIPKPAVPDFSLMRSLWPDALGLALMSFTESIAAGRAFAASNDPQPVPDRELIAVGVANVAASFFQGFPSGGGTSQTAVNARAGARSQISALVTAGMVLATLLFLSPLISLLPQATLAAIVVVTAFSLLSLTGFRAILQIRRTEFFWALTACGGVILLGTLHGILVAVAISLLTLVYQANHPLVYAMRRKPGTDVFRPESERHPTDETVPGLLIVRTEGRMTFASAPRARDDMRAMIEAAKPEVVILECSAIPDFEYTALRELIQAEDNMRKSGVTLWLTALNPEAFDVVMRSQLGQTLGRERMFLDLSDAVREFEKRQTTEKRGTTVVGRV